MTVNSPVALLIFNRPDTTQLVFDAIRAAQPSTLLVVADGPRADVPTDAARCQQARAITEQVDWDCTVYRNYAEHNLGCRERVSSGLDWVFETVEEAIILEDDCLPHPTFFPYCEELLNRYRDDERVMHISGDNFLQNSPETGESYYFSKYSHVWGWATWRRAWEHYDVALSLWQQSTVRHRFLCQFPNSRERTFWSHVLDEVANGNIDTWDYQWSFAVIASHGLAINPIHNLVRNLGFGSQSTHTAHPLSGWPNEHRPLDFPLRHPASLLPVPEADAEVAAKFFSRDASNRLLRRWQRVMRYVKAG